VCDNGCLPAARRRWVCDAGGEIALFEAVYRGELVDLPRIWFGAFTGSFTGLGQVLR